MFLYSLLPCCLLLCRTLTHTHTLFTNAIKITCHSGVEKGIKKGWSQYYQLNIEYYMTWSAHCVLTLLNKNYAWVHTLASSSSNEEIQQYPKQLSKVASNLKHAVSMEMEPQQSTSTLFHEMLSPPPTTNKDPEQERETTKACQAVMDLATEQLNANITQVVKQQIFTNT